MVEWVYLKMLVLCFAHFKYFHFLKRENQFSFNQRQLRDVMFTKKLKSYTFVQWDATTRQFV